MHIYTLLYVCMHIYTLYRLCMHIHTLYILTHCRFDCRVYAHIHTVHMCVCTCTHYTDVCMRIYTLNILCMHMYSGRWIDDRQTGVYVHIWICIDREIEIDVER